MLPAGYIFHRRFVPALPYPPEPQFVTLFGGVTAGNHVVVGDHELDIKLRYPTKVSSIALILVYVICASPLHYGEY